MKKQITTKTVIILVIVLMIWSIITIVDYKQVCHNFEKPVFAIPEITEDDGGSGIYKGLGYSYDIKGNFMPEDEFPDVTHAKFYLFGKHVKESIRD